MDKPQEMSKALADVWAERRRQVSQEGWSEDHDDHHDTGELALAASCYAWAASLGEDGQEDVKVYPFTGEEGRFVREFWPWDASWWKHASPRRMLVKACALLLAEIERIDRAAHSPKGEDTQQAQPAPTTQGERTMNKHTPSPWSGRGTLKQNAVVIMSLAAGSASIALFWYGLNDVLAWLWRIVT